MEHPVKVAPCALLFSANGGKFTALGMPIFQSRSIRPDDVDPEDDEAVALLCDIAFDCGTCPLLYQWVQAEMVRGWSVGWECTKCLNDSYKVERYDPNVERRLPGFYQSGRPSVPEGHEDHDPDRPALPGCTSCGWGSSFLQLVLRRQRPR